MSNVRPLRQSVRPSPVFLAIVAITVAGGAIAWVAGEPRSALSYVGTFVFVVFGWLVSLPHAAWNGRSVSGRGRVQLVPPSSE